MASMPIASTPIAACQDVVYADDVMARELGRQGHVLTPLGDAYRAKLASLQVAAAEAGAREGRAMGAGWVGQRVWRRD
jgi:hypothetical protein